MMQVSYYQLESMISTLQQAVKVSSESPTNPDEGYAFANGYSRSAMQMVIGELNRIMINQSNYESECG
jgi:hypothetical protein